MIRRPLVNVNEKVPGYLEGALALGCVLGGGLAEPVGRRAVGVVLELAGCAADLADAAAGLPTRAGDAPVVLAALLLVCLSVAPPLSHRILLPPPPPRRGPPRPPPPPPPPPPKPPKPPRPSREGGRASSTLIVRPSSGFPFSSSIALRPSALVAISTKPKPRERPEERAVTTLADSTVPGCSEKARR